MSLFPRLILLVEDEPLVRWIAVEALESAGFDVLQAEDAAQALDILQSRRDVGLLFTDVNMPGQLDGLALAELVHARWPDMRLVVTSALGLDRAAPGDGTFLPKPYSIGQLERAVLASGFDPDDAPPPGDDGTT